MNKMKAAKTISTLTNPPIICIPLFLIISFVLSFENGTFDFVKFISVEAIALVFTSVLPMAIILYWARKLNTDEDISNREDRFTPLIVGVVSYFIGFLISFIFNVDNFLTALLLCYSTNTFIVMLITLKWKISIHTTALSGPNAALILLLGPFGAIFGILYPLIIWSRVTLNKHTMAQAICGGVQGYYLTVFEMYLFMAVLNLPVESLVGLVNSSLFVLAIIMTPIVLGFLSYISVSNKKIVFCISEAVLLIVFLAFTPFDVFAVFVIVTLTSVFVSLYAGDDYSWFNVLKS